ncbi:flagellar hook-length control protein FliK [Paragemmobacter straminiformis]|uniref:Flagellar hook-length control protein FliK n=1 Tax=Paragemmobacter straminiformis TaxID=2045119 RepID=A0A842I545_9RHOB|nr:flagellar hook-length control protein FliK [Gemmobacter straminiformis]MBC2834776.1 flagellar hook-length control protein FliK [Gemmobacter straminiformis]
MTPVILPALAMTEPVAGAVQPAAVAAGGGDFAGDLAKALGDAPDSADAAKVTAAAPAETAPFGDVVGGDVAVKASVGGVAAGGAAAATKALLAGLMGGSALGAALAAGGAVADVVPVAGDAARLGGGAGGQGEAVALPEPAAQQGQAAEDGAEPPPGAQDILPEPQLAVGAGDGSADGAAIEPATAEADTAPEAEDALPAPLEALTVAVPAVPLPVAAEVAEPASDARADEDETAPEALDHAEVAQALDSALAQAVMAPALELAQAAPAMAERAVQVKIEAFATLPAALPAAALAAEAPKEAAAKDKPADALRMPVQDAALQVVTVAARAEVTPEGKARKPEIAVDATLDPATGAAQLQAQVASAALPELRLAAPPLRTDLPGWEQVLADRIAADLSDDGQEIELSLSPEKLGPLRIKLELSDGQAQVKIVTATPEAAKLFTESQHRLSESLSRAGVDLGGQSAESRQPRDERQAPRGPRATEFLAQTRRSEGGSIAIPRSAGAGLVNLMA